MAVTRLHDVSAEHVRRLCGVPHPFRSMVRSPLWLIGAFVVVFLVFVWLVGGIMSAGADIFRAHAEQVLRSL